MARRWLPAWGLAAIAFGGASLIVPLYLVELGASAFDLGILFATASFVGIPGALVCGNLADKTGKRRVFVVAAFVVTIVTMLVIPFLESILLVILVNAALWLGFAAAIPVLTLLVITGEPDDQWGPLIASLNKYQGIGWALGLALGFVIITVATRSVEPITAQRWFFVTCGVAAATGFLLALRTLPPDPGAGEAPSPRRLRRRLRDVQRFNIRGASFPFTPSRFDPRQLHPGRLGERFSPALATYFGAVFLMFTGFGAFFAPLPAYLAGIGYGANEIFALYLVLNTGAALFYGPAASLAAKYSLFEVHMGGLLGRSIAFPLIGVLGLLLGGTIFGIGGLLLVCFIIGITWAIIAVTAATLVTKLSPVIIRGEALGVYGALVAFGGGVGGLVGGWLAGAGYLLTFTTAGGLVLVGIVIVFGLSRQALFHTPAADVDAT